MLVRIIKKNSQIAHQEMLIHTTTVALEALIVPSVYIAVHDVEERDHHWYKELIVDMFLKFAFMPLRTEVSSLGSSSLLSNTAKEYLAGVINDFVPSYLYGFALAPSKKEVEKVANEIFQSSKFQSDLQNFEKLIKENSKLQLRGYSLNDPS